MEKENVVYDKTYEFAIRIVKAYQFFNEGKKRVSIIKAVIEKRYFNWSEYCGSQRRSLKD